MKRILATLALAAAALSLAGVELGKAFPASAAVSTTCSVSGTANFSRPSGGGISTTAATTSTNVSGWLTNCSGGTVSSGFFSASLTSVQSCTTTSSATTNSIAVRWNTGQQSFASATLTRTAINRGSISGTVTQGLFSGQHFSGALTFQATSGRCQTGSSVTRASMTGSGSL